MLVGDQVAVLPTLIVHRVAIWLQRGSYVTTTTKERETFPLSCKRHGQNTWSAGDLRRAWPF